MYVTTGTSQLPVRHISNSKVNLRCVSQSTWELVWLALTKESYHSICSASDEQVAVVVEGHAMNTYWQRLHGQRALWG